jgi:hypothetical protein
MNNFDKALTESIKAYSEISGQTFEDIRVKALSGCQVTQDILTKYMAVLAA